jgi:large subunit ribosomal protein L21
MVADQDKVNFGMPTIKGKIHATVLAHRKDEKIRIVKKKRRKGYRVNRGHRQQFTTIKVESITL